MTSGSAMREGPCGAGARLGWVVAVTALLAAGCGAAGGGAEAVCGGGADGTPCGAGHVCRSRACVEACVAGDACTVSSPCKLGKTACAAAWGPSTCVAAANGPDGAECGFGQVCAAGECVASSTVDVLLVVDDSGTMLPKQERLAQGFAAFVGQVAATQAARAQRGLAPLDVHVAVTTSSIFEGDQAGSATCAAGAGAGAPLRCDVAAPAFGWTAPYGYACTTAGAPCADLVKRYAFFDGVCTPGLAVKGAPYPAGDFVGAAGNPRVLHFAKDLGWESWGTPSVDPRLLALVAQFQQNVAVGSCGSGMEQHLEAGRLALQKALADGQPGVAHGEWPHPAAKLVAMFVGDEDDCSNPDDPLRALFFVPGSTAPGSDVCVADEALPPQQRKAFPVEGYADFLTSLGRPFAAAFVSSAVNCRTDGSGGSVCDPGKCQPAGCAPDSTDPACLGGLSAGTRFHDLAAALRARGATALEASVCDDFSAMMGRVATSLVAVPPP